MEIKILARFWSICNSELKWKKSHAKPGCISSTQAIARARLARTHHGTYLFMGSWSKKAKNWSTYFMTEPKLDFHTGHVPSSETDALKKKSYLFFLFLFWFCPLGLFGPALETLFPGGLFWDFRSIYTVNIWKGGCVLFGNVN